MNIAQLEDNKGIIKFVAEMQFLEGFIKKADKNELFRFLLSENYEPSGKFLRSYKFHIQESIDNFRGLELAEDFQEGKVESSVKGIKDKIDKTADDLQKAIEDAIGSKKFDELKKLQGMSTSLKVMKKEIEKKQSFGLSDVFKVIWFLVKLAMALAMIVLGAVAIYTIIIAITAIIATVSPYLFASAATTSSVAATVWGTNALAALGFGTATTTSTVLAGMAASGAASAVGAASGALVPLAGVGALITASVVVQIGLASLAFVTLVIAITYKVSSLKSEALSDEEKDNYVKELQVKALEIKKIVDSKIKNA